MTTHAQAKPGLRAGPKEWLGLAVLALPTLLLSLDVTVLFLALPHLSADLGANSTESLWIMDIYGFMIAGFLITMGTLGDRIGRRRLLIAGGTAFGIASVLAAYSTSPEMLIATRALLGIAGATLMPSTLSLITNMFLDAKQRGLAIGVWVSCFSLGIAIGPVVGGVMLESFWWGSVFLLAVPVMALLLVLGPILLPESRDAEAGRIDIASVLLSLAAMIPLIYGIKELAKHGLSGAAIATLIIGVAFAAVFAVRQRRLENPLLDLRLFSNRSFTVALTVLLLGLVTIGGIYLFVTQYLQLVADLSPLETGLWLLPAALAMTAASMMAPGLAQRLRPSVVVGVSLFISAVGFFILTQADAASGLAVVVTGFAVLYFGTGPMMALGTDLVVGSAPPEKAGSASAMSETAMEMGVALGVAALGSVGAAVYQSQINGSVPAGTPEAAAAAAEDSLASASAEAANMSEGAATALLEPAREAFTSALNVVGGISAVVIALLAVLALVALRNIGGGEEPGAEAEADAPVETPAPAGDPLVAAQQSS
ncbi:MFS transporter [Streptomyces sp. TRM 70351]|uniref:MFS transporter n=1 Tax=Streptomyces sp. TRM 70351 TaxID=3116552 RepID=UPI002E7C2187|nr:MFS transporter [Streptomyces sp. TRM 70351]MEE1929761.1 MFS transporter [Streptomyces sp. TRM 70351]